MVDDYAAPVGEFGNEVKFGMARQGDVNSVDDKPTLYALFHGQYTGDLCRVYVALLIEVPDKGICRLGCSGDTVGHRRCFLSELPFVGLNLVDFLIGALLQFGYLFQLAVAETCEE